MATEVTGQQSEPATQPCETRAHLAGFGALSLWKSAIVNRHNLRRGSQTETQSETSRLAVVMDGEA